MFSINSFSLNELCMIIITNSTTYFELGKLRCWIAQVPLYIHCILYI